MLSSGLCSGATNTSARVEASYQLAFLLASRATPSTPDTSNDSRDPQVTLWMTVRKRKWELARTAPIFYGSGHMPFHVGPVRPVKKVALSSNNVRLRHAEEQSMRTSRPPGMGRRCAPRRQHRPPSGDPHPGDGAMASRPSRRSTTCPWRLSGSSGPPSTYLGTWRVGPPGLSNRNLWKKGSCPGAP